jgi:hypothetical protein
MRAYVFWGLLSMVSVVHGMNSHNFGLNESCSALNVFRILTVATPLTITGVTACDALYRKASFGAKKFISIGACTMVYTAACLHIYENYASSNDMMGCVASWFIVGGNGAIAEFLRR